MREALWSDRSKQLAPPVCVIGNLHSSQTNLVAFLCLVVPVGVWEMDVAARLLHHPLDVVATFANNVGVLRVGNVHLQSYPVTLMSRKQRVRLKRWLMTLAVAQRDEQHARKKRHLLCYYLCQGGYVSTLCACVCWLFDQQDYTKTTEQIFTKPRWKMGIGSHQKPLSFGADPGFFPLLFNMASFFFFFKFTRIKHGWWWKKSSWLVSMSEYNWIQILDLVTLNYG